MIKPRGKDKTMSNLSTTVSTPVAVDANQIFSALETWIKQRPGLDARDYGGGMDGWRAYRQELRQISKDRQRAMKALDEAKGLTPAMPNVLLDSFRAFSGRLEWKLDEGRLVYCTGQYWPTEYRKAAASVLERYVSSWQQNWANAHPQTFTYRTMDDVIAANRAIGNHWFEPSTMRFFKTRIESGAVARYDDDGKPTRARFITSEKGPDGVRKYSVREAQPDGTIDTVGEFQQYRTRDAARAALLKGEVRS
jgi:hypothetical protein